MDGCSGFPPDSQTASIKQYSVGLRAVTVRAIRAEGGIHTQTVTAKKLQQPYTGPLQPFFRNKKPQAPYLQTLVFLPHLSSSSDLRILSSTQPSQVSPMTDFRLVRVPPRIQWRYRPGFSPGYLFSCGAVTASTGTQTEYLLARSVYTIRVQMSISKRKDLNI